MKHMIMKKLLILTIILISSISFNTAANILALLPTASPSHHIWNSALVTSLANRGHNVTVVSPQAQKTSVPNLTDLVITGLYEQADEEYDFEGMSEMLPIVTMNLFFHFYADQCIKTLKHHAWTQLMNYSPETKFDLVIIESIGTECLLGALSRFGNPPIVSVQGFNAPQLVFQRTGTPNTISYIPHFMYSVTDSMTFFQRITNTFYNAMYHYFYYYNYLPQMDKVSQEYYGPQSPTFSEIQDSICIEIANFHPALDYPYAKAPNLIHVAGIQIKDPKPLPKDIQTFLDNAKDGAIFFSLGTNVKSEKILPEKRKAIMDAFAEIPQKVLWKFEADTLPGQPENVKISKWLPQSDILAHPNIKVFITHAGLLSTHEAIFRGVPVIGIPFFGDQPINIQKIVNHGAGVRLEYRDVTKESLLKALHSVLHDPRYRKNMKTLSERIQDDPETPLERAVFWTEYVLRHNGAPHLRSAAKDLNVIQYFLLDVISVLLTVPTLIIILLHYLCCTKRPKDKRKLKKN